MPTTPCVSSTELYPFLDLDPLGLSVSLEVQLYPHRLNKITTTSHYSLLQKCILKNLYHGQHHCIVEK